MKNIEVQFNKDSKFWREELIIIKEAVSSSQIAENNLLFNQGIEKVSGYEPARRSHM
ncbi:MAG: hypothetical protein ABJF11_06900 [Reichenbachiella sp.]|uniref:hypothetical protein n=1 Tax=Reichenbachiella sp. TaxID=2184521 RepID=UPI0032638174